MSVRYPTLAGMVLFFHPSTFWTKLLIFLRVVPDLLGTRSLVLEHVVHARPITFTRMTQYTVMAVL